MISALDASETGHSNAGQERTSGGEPQAKTKAKYLRVTVTPNSGDQNSGNEHMFHDRNVQRVNIRVPMSLIRAGIKMKSLIPPEAKDKVNSALREKGIKFDIDSIKNEDIEDLVEALGDMEIDVEGGHGEKVKVYVE
jgi:hypothetical protein